MFSFQRHRVWKIANGYISIRFGGRLDVSSDGCCVKVAWGPGGSITGKVPIPGLPPIISLRPSGSASIRSSYKFCIGDGGGKLSSADLSVALALGLRGELPGVENVVVVFVEGGGYVSGKWDLINGTKNKYAAGWYARGVFDVNIGSLWNERYEFKWTSSGDADIM